MALCAGKPRQPSHLGKGPLAWRVLGMFEEAGCLQLAGVLGALLRRPGQIGDLLALARDAAAARRALLARVRMVRGL